MKFKVPFVAVSGLAFAACLIPTSASAQLPPLQGTTPTPRSGDAPTVLWGAPKEPRRNYVSTPIRRPLPSVAPWDEPGYDRDARDVKKSTTWEAPTRLDRKIEEEIQQAQIDYGPQDVKVAQLMWRHAQNYYNSNDYSKAKDLLRKLLDMADHDIRTKLPMKKVQAMYAESARKMQPLADSRYKPFSYSHATHFNSIYGQYLNGPDVNKTQVGRGTFVYSTPSNTPLLTAANTSQKANAGGGNSGAGGKSGSGAGNASGGSGGVLVNGPNFSYRVIGPATIKQNGVEIMIPAGASGTLNISTTPPRRSNGKPAAVKYLPLSAPLRYGTRGPGTFDTGGFHDLDPGFTIHTR